MDSEKKSSSSNIYYASFLVVLLLVLFFYFFANGNFNNLSLSSSSESSKIPIPSTSTSISGCTTCSVVTTPPTDTIIKSTGTKRALLFGCNYNFPGSICISEGCVLNGCIDDVNNIRSFLLTLGYQSQNIQLYTDLNSYNTANFPTREFMLNKIQELVSETNEGDSSFIWYSGHGSQIPNSEAEGGYFECWCPPDTLRNGNFITDVELNQRVSSLKKGAKLFIGSDSCHSGTVFNLQYFLCEPNAINFRSTVNKNSKTTVPKLMANTSLLSKNIIPLEINRSTKNSMVLVFDSSYTDIKGSIISLSGCQDQDVSADAFENGSAQGAMTWSFLTTVRQVLAQNGSIQDLLRNMRILLSSNGYSQIPQMESSLNIDVTTSISDLLL